MEAKRIFLYNDEGELFVSFDLFIKDWPQLIKFKNKYYVLNEEDSDWGPSPNIEYLETELFVVKKIVKGMDPMYY